MNKISVFPGKYVQGQGALTSLPFFVNLLGTKALVLVSPSVKQYVEKNHSEDGIFRKMNIEVFHGECCEEEIHRLTQVFVDQKTDVVVGMGGGKVIDTAKILADRAWKPVIIVPTIASTDAPCSGCAVTYTPAGEFEKVHYQRMNPAVVLVDMDIIAAAPSRFLVAGMGDALATWFEARSCAESNSMNECGGTSTLTSQYLARLCYDTLLKYGVQARNDNENALVSPALHHITEANILLSGIGFESGGVAAAHAIHNGLTALEETHAYYHGEKVAFGLLVGLHLSVKSVAELDQVYAFCEAVGLPTTLASLGLHDLNDEQLMKVALKTTEPGSIVYHEPMEITPGRIIQAIIQADTMGRKRFKKLNT